MAQEMQLDALAEWLAQHVQRKLGLETQGSVAQVLGGNFASIRFADLPKPNGVSLVLTNTISRVSVETVFDNFAKPLIVSMSDHTPDDYAVWESLVLSAKSEGIKVLLEVNGHQYSDAEPLPHDTWDHFHLEVSGPIGRALPRTQAAEKVSTIAVSLLLTLMNVEEPDSVENDDEISIGNLGEVEGKKMRVAINRYERSRKNRAACINIYGAKCQVCKLDFSEMYGTLGQGYIEVHHRTPVSLMGREYALNPKRDLIPVCSNCHRMMHRKWPPISPEGLAEIVEEERNERIKEE